MSHWNHRVGVKTSEHGPLYSIVEVYYDEESQPEAYAERQILANWETYEDLEGTWKQVKSAFEKPILNLDAFPNEFNNKTDDTNRTSS